MDELGGRAWICLVETRFWMGLGCFAWTFFGRIGLWSVLDWNGGLVGWLLVLDFTLLV